ncbi:MAG: CBS domain-containing protein [Myxococcaceae bacterium]|nr:CBS domain-containing protein [Myxococcaceae bacterium]
MLLVSELMSYDVLTISAEAPLLQAEAEMRLGRIRHLPVLDAKGRLTGLLSTHDLAKALAKTPGNRVVDVMSVRVVSVREDVPAAEAARLMRQKKIGSLPVLDAKGRLVGVLTESDFLEVAERALSGKPLRRP